MYDSVHRFTYIAYIHTCNLHASSSRITQVGYGLLSKLLPFLDGTNEDLLESVLRLIFNLSFDQQQRAELVSRAVSGMLMACMLMGYVTRARSTVHVCLTLCYRCYA